MDLPRCHFMLLAGIFMTGRLAEPSWYVHNCGPSQKNKMVSPLLIVIFCMMVWLKVPNLSSTKKTLHMAMGLYIYMLKGGTAALLSSQCGFPIGCFLKVVGDVGVSLVISLSRFCWSAIANISLFLLLVVIVSKRISNHCWYCFRCLILLKHWCSISETWNVATANPTVSVGSPSRWLLMENGRSSSR